MTTTSNFKSTLLAPAPLASLPRSSVVLIAASLGVALGMPLAVTAEPLGRPPGGSRLRPPPPGAAGPAAPDAAHADDLRGGRLASWIPVPSGRAPRTGSARSPRPSPRRRNRRRCALPPGSPVRATAGTAGRG